MRSLGVCLSLVIGSTVFGAYSARLSFRNASTGATNAGAVEAHPGDNIEIWYSFHKLDNVNPLKWGSMQVTLCFDGLSLVGAADQANWGASIAAVETVGGPASDFLTTVVGNGALYDWGIDSSESSKPKICDNGLYLYVGIIGSKSRSQDWDAMLWSFTVQPGSAGQTLNWALDGRETGTGLSTRIFDQKNASVDITDNWVTVVPEPDGVAFSLATGLILITARCKRNGPRNATA